MLKANRGDQEDSHQLCTHQYLEIGSGEAKVEITGCPFKEDHLGGPPEGVRPSTGAALERRSPGKARWLGQRTDRGGRAARVDSGSHTLPEGRNGLEVLGRLAKGRCPAQLPQGVGDPVHVLKDFTGSLAQR